MLQQTQVARVVPAYLRFMERFPTLRALARASLGDVLRSWSGLGYNRRARDLHRTARLHPRSLPRSVEELDALPGVGAYTAGAVACFAHGERVAFADTNIRRVLGRALLGRIATERDARALDERLIPRSGADRWHHALMDIGATICLARAPRCETCPIATLCRARACGEVRPARPRRQSPFATSDRRARGLIVSALREAPRGLTRAALSRLVPPARLDRLVSGLLADGLIEAADTMLRLPA